MPAFSPVKERLDRLSIRDPNCGCWIWTGCIDKCGYGKFNVGKESLAHRASYKEYVGPIPDDCEIDHKCKVRCCINPQHLQAISHAENVKLADHKTGHRNTKKTHCIRGHEFSDENTFIEVWNGIRMRKCKVCTRAKNARANAKKRQRLVEALYPGVSITEV